MVKNPKLLEAFERNLEKQEAVDFEKNFRILEALYREACLLGVFPLTNPLEGIEVDLRLARAMNVRTSP